MKKIGEKISEIAKSKGFSANLLAKKLGVTRQSVYDMYNNRVEITLNRVYELADILDVDLFEFISQLDGKTSISDSIKHKKLFALLNKINDISAQNIIPFNEVINLLQLQEIKKHNRMLEKFMLSIGKFNIQWQGGNSNVNDKN